MEQHDDIDVSTTSRIRRATLQFSLEASDGLLMRRRYVASDVRSLGLELLPRR